MDNDDSYRSPYFTRALPGALDGLAGMGAPPGTALPPATSQSRQLVRLPNGVFVDPQQIAAVTGAPVPAVLAAALAVWRARSVSEAQTAVDQVERAYGLRGNALQSIADAKKPVAVVAAPQMHGMGNIFGDVWDDVSGAASDVYDFAKDDVLPVAADVVAFPITGPLGLIAPDPLKPHNIVQNPKAAVAAGYDGVKWFAKAGGTLTGKTLVNLGKAFTALPATAPAPAPAPVQQAGILGSLGLGGSMTPLLLGGLGLALALIFRHHDKHP